MAEIFVSYEREDADRAGQIVDALRKEGFDVWWDQRIHSGARWRSDIEQNLSSARVVVCLWSNTSVASTFVLDEARDAAQRGVLCPILIDDVSIPLGFREIQAAELIGWSGARGDPAWSYVVQSIRARLSGAPPPERTPPRPRRPILPLIAGAITIVAAALSLVAASEQFGWSDFIPGFPAATATLAASPQEQTAWRAASLRQDRCEAMRGFLQEHPEGRYAGQAQTILASRAERPATRWAPFSSPSLVTGTSSLNDRATQARACQSAQESARRNAQSGCDIYSGDAQRFRNVEVALGDLTCDCRDHAIRIEGAGEVDAIWRCNVRATYHCRGEAMESTTEEFCGAPASEQAK